ncbi:Ribosomal protein L11 methyltransferase [uncultured Paludibacter sp.]|uniref:Ribosomal protein L11 methyltransferase n=1 Tax=uncultured Paludibacter sp. TaxID=497635 RepID=A0A653AGC8_9BACT|nr:Ribosomal protein L11 methyltransferase [uncultured Paludibacter sp.]
MSQKNPLSLFIKYLFYFSSYVVMKYTVVHLFFDIEKDYISDILAAYLGEINFDSFVETEKGLDAYILSSEFDRNLLQKHLSNFSFDENIRFEHNETEDKNWNEEWEKYFFEPIIIDNQCVIHSSFHKDYPVCKYDITIDPKMAFGTGHHETTSLMIAEILEMNLEGKSVLDMGCGTSVLAILAEKRGAKHITAIDIDNWCTENSLENIQLNNSKNITVLLGGTELLRDMFFDVILANINRNILLADMSAYVSCLKSNGELYMSGFYTEDIPILEQKATELGLEKIHSKEKNNWAAVKFVKL